MKKIEEYIENSENNNRMIQKALREFDLESLYDLCAYLGDGNDLILRNLSERVRDGVLGYLQKNKNKIPQSAMKRAYFKFSKILLFLNSNNVKGSEEFLVDKLSFETAEDIQKSLITIFHYNKNRELEILNDMIHSVDDLLIRKQLELVLYGFDPLKGEDRLERLQKQKLEKEAIKAEMLKEGIISILSEESIESLYGKFDV